jgi:nickel-dependent lactate racemase
MKIKLAFGKAGLCIELPDELDITVIESDKLPICEDPFTALIEALEAPIGSIPLRERVGVDDQVAIVVNDITRHTPTPLLISAIQEVLAHVPNENFKIFIATGTHRRNTSTELISMLGEEWVHAFPIIQNDAEEPGAYSFVGTTASGNEVFFHGELMQCDIRIATGFIEPHLFAGFSGGGKAFLPGMARLDSILHNHSPSHVGHPNAGWGNIKDNPILEDIRQASRFAEPSFLLNVTLDRKQGITNVFAGDVHAAHTAGCAFVKEHNMVPVEEPFDIIITSNAGYPLDLNIYQSVKGMSAAAEVIRTNGSIIIAAECWDGIPEHGLYAEIMRESSSPKALLEELISMGPSKRDAWQAQIQAAISSKADIYLFSDKLSDETIRSVHLKPINSIEKILGELILEYGRDARIGVMPEGPLTVPYLVAE